MSKLQRAAAAAFVAGAACAALTANAQVYRIVGPDGRVTYSDRPPVDAKASQAPSAPAASGGGASTASLPAEVRAAASRFPVTLYTSADCGPCVSARGFLAQRGVPFSERTIATPADAQALQRLSGGTGLPFATIGGQHIRGFADTEWSQYLDAAGYPRTSQLPASYRNPPATPLVAEQQVRPPAAAQAQRPQQAAPQADAQSPSAPSVENPAGIRF